MHIEIYMLQDKIDKLENRICAIEDELLHMRDFFCDIDMKFLQLRAKKEEKNGEIS